MDLRLCSVRSSYVRLWSRPFISLEEIRQEYIHQINKLHIIASGGCVVIVSALRILVTS